MTLPIKSGAVIFTTDHSRLAVFYTEVLGMTVEGADAHHTVLTTATCAARPSRTPR